MAGFIENSKNPFKNISKNLKKISNFGMDYDNMVVKKSYALGVSETDQLNLYNPNHIQGLEDDDPYSIFASLSLPNNNLNKNISFFNQDYITKREELRDFAVQDEIERILDITVDEAIVYNESNFFAYSDYNGDITDLSDEIRNQIIDEFNRIYNLFGFGTSNRAWEYFRKFLIDGFLAFEIIYDDVQNPKKIIGFKELDTLTLAPGYNKEGKLNVWVQFPGSGSERQLLDSQIIYLSFSGYNSPNRVSFVERLIRSFNLLRIMETTRIIWAVSNSSFKTQFTIPVGNRSKGRAKQSLSQLMNRYREVVDFDYNSGVIKTNGKPMIPFNKEYWLPQNESGTPEISTIGGDGPELGDTESLKYFSDKLNAASKIPFQRLSREEQATNDMDANGMLREEINFSNHINRLRSLFKEILVKPLYLQLCLNNPELQNDKNFESRLSVKFEKNNVFEELKEMELLSRKADFIGNMISQIQVTDSEGNEKPYFSLDFLVQRYSGLSIEDIEENKKAKERDELKEEGYKKEDIKKIIKGEPKSKFKPEKPNEDKEDDF